MPRPKFLSFQRKKQSKTPKISKESSSASTTNFNKETLIPKKLHSIWLGSPPKEEDLNNLIKWKIINPDYEVNIWIDSFALTFEKSDTESKIKFVAFLEKAKKNGIIVNDIGKSSRVYGRSGSEDTQIEAIKGIEQFKIHDKTTLRENMINLNFYEDEITGLDKNLAAASDILRVEILDKEGGVYIDIGDVFPNPDQPLGQLKFSEGFAYHVHDNLAVNNDILASVPQGEVIFNVKNEINQRYKRLYGFEEKTKAFELDEDTDQNELFHTHSLVSSHRSDAVSEPSARMASRRSTTIQTSGPNAVNAAAMKHINLKEDFVQDPERQIKTFQFPNNKVILPKSQALGWFQNVSIKFVEKTLRLRIKEGIIQLIKDPNGKFSKFPNDSKMLLVQFLEKSPNGVPLNNILRTVKQEAEKKGLKIPSDNLKYLIKIARNGEILLADLKTLGILPQELKTRIEKIASTQEINALISNLKSTSTFSQAKSMLHPKMDNNAKSRRKKK